MTSHNINIWAASNTGQQTLAAALKSHFKVQISQQGQKGQTSVIAAYRKPIERLISHFLQNSDVLCPHCEDVDQLIDNFNNYILTYQEDTFYFREILPSSMKKIPHIKAHKGHHNNINYYLIEFADINNWSSVLSSIFDRTIKSEPPPLTDSKKYTEFNERYQIPSYVLEKIFNRKHSPIMYEMCSSDEIDSDYKYWKSRQVPSIIKTLVGKNNTLFLVNDSNGELEKRYGEIQPEPTIHFIDIIKKYLHKYLVVNIPDKSFICKKDLPNYYLVNGPFRKDFEYMRSIIKDHMVDMSPLFADKDIFYKTDTHINKNASYILYTNTIKKINDLFKHQITPYVIKLKKKSIELRELGIGLGDLTWESNKGSMRVNYTDNYYYCDDIIQFYCKYQLKNENVYGMKLYDKTFNDKTNELAGQFIDWNIVSENTFVSNHPEGYNLKVLIFYDSMLLRTIDLWMKTFKTCIFHKAEPSDKVIGYFNPDLILQIGIERFL